MAARAMLHRWSVLTLAVGLLGCHGRDKAGDDTDRVTDDIRTDTDLADTDLADSDLPDTGSTGSTGFPETAESGMLVDSASTGLDSASTGWDSASTGFDSASTGFDSASTGWVATGDSWGTGVYDSAWDTAWDSGFIGPDSSGWDSACDDRDGDGWGCDDCDDRDPFVHPTAPEVCNGLDDDCDGAWDEGFRWWPDADHDQYGDASATAVLDCNGPPAAVPDAVQNAGDCDDHDAAVHPGALDVCGDNVDNDCSGAPENAALCPCVDAPEGGHDYLYCPIDASWSDALAACRALGEDLYAVSDDAEHDPVAAIAAAVDDRVWWMGLGDQASEGTFTWSDGEPLAVTPTWASTEPDGTATDAQDCVSFGPSSITGWRDDDCAAMHGYICEH